MKAPASIITVIALGVLLLSGYGHSQQVFFGNLHSHTSYSDGSGTPEQAYRHARDVAGLDFLAITEHNHRWAESGAAADRRDGLLIATNPSLYAGPQPEALIPTANRLTEDGRFVAIYGQEFSSISRGNHINVFDVGSVITIANGEFDDLVTWLASNPDTTGETTIIQLNHPSLFSDDDTEYGADDFPSKVQWIAALDPLATLIEIVNGPAMTRVGGRRPAEIMEADYRDYLNLGFHLAPTADQDNHYFTWGTATEARTGVVADSLTKANILNALRNRHVYATEDRNLRLTFRVNGHLMGDIVRDVPTNGSPLRIEFTIHDDDEPIGAYTVQLFSDAGPGGAEARVIETVQVEGNTAPNGAETIDGITFVGPGQYLFLRVRQIDEDGNHDRAWTAPVWFESAAPTGNTTIPIINVGIASLLPNPAGNEAINEEATIMNNGTAPVNMIGWRLRDRARTEWALDSLGTLNPGESGIIQRDGQPMGMNNSGDSITLIDATGNPIQTVTYGRVAEGQRVP